MTNLVLTFCAFFGCANHIDFLAALRHIFGIVDRRTRIERLLSRLVGATLLGTFPRPQKVTQP